MWIGCCQPPELFSRIHRSAEFRFTVKRIWSQSKNFPLTCHWPLPRSKRNRRVIRGVGRVHAVVAHGVAHEPELHEHVLALARGQDLARRAPAVDLLEAILQPETL